MKLILTIVCGKLKHPRMTPHESISFTREQLVSDLAAGERSCPICARATGDDYVGVDSMAEDLQKLIVANAPGVPDVEEVCGRCARLFERAKAQILKDAAMQKDG